MQQKSKKSNKKQVKEQKTAQKNPLTKLIIRMVILSTMIGSIIFYSDKKGYFTPDETNNHTLKKWNSFYELTSKSNKIDVMLFGNSHLYTGINPKNLSLTLGTTAFVFASPGTNIADSYFGLKEAIKECKPKLVIVETFGMNDFNPYKLEKGGLSDQFKSFSARKNFLTMLISTPYLFSSDNYFYAWSTTIRNHDYLFTNQEQLKKNSAIIDVSNEQKSSKKLYLGRYVRFTSGIEKEVLERYEKEGSPVKGADYKYSKYTELYVKKFIELCDKENIELMFLTLPMYKEHVEDYDLWQKKLSKVLSKYPNKWMDMQTMPNYDGFGAFAFENTYSRNQHMTYNGSLLATYKLAEFIRDSLSVELPQRQHDGKWHNLLYGDEGYFENFNPSKNDKNNILICSKKTLKNTKLESLLQLDINNKKANKMIAKVNKQTLKNINYQDVKLRLILKFEDEGKEQIASLDMAYDGLHKPKNEIIFTSMVKPLKIKDVIDGAIVKN